MVLTDGTSRALVDGRPSVLLDSTVDGKHDTCCYVTALALCWDNSQTPHPPSGSAMRAGARLSG